ncbi:MAG: respiratory nitrate reductase subunit gamma [Deltaproteobacteria bacterium]|nr:respiratory nitrate reductase subunit gamma [Deltaproteobacteria bacterium]
MTPAREILGNIPPGLQAAMYVATLGAAAVAALKIAAQVRRWRRGGPEPRLLPRAERLRAFARRAVAQRDIAERDRLAGAMHRMIFWGFAVLFLATVLTAIDHDLGIPLLHGPFYLFFAFVVDLFGVLFIAGLLLAVYRRYVVRLAQLGYGRPGDAAALLCLLLAGVTGFWLEGARIALDGWPDYERLSFAGWFSGLLLEPLVSSWPSAHRIIWSLHIAAVSALFACLPFTRLLHMLATPANLLLRARPLGGLRPVRGEAAPQATFAAFSWKQLLELDACTSCGRCSQVCPATTAGKPLSPMLVIQHLREALAGERPAGDLIGAVVAPDELWSCTTCGACEEVCPVAINHIDRLVDLRRVLVDRGEIQATGARALESMLGKDNPWDHAPGERARWAERLGLRVLREGESCDTIYWIGCAGAYDEQARSVSEAVAKLLQRAGVDFAILGAREGCTGDLARRLGEEGLFAELARRNTAVIRAHGVTRIITHCPHCLNTFRTEYDLAGIEIVHHSQLLQQLVSAGRLQPARPAAQRVTLHDPCYLGRYNGLFDQPRAALAAIPQVELKEMPRARAQSFCCGGGGGQVLIDVKGGQRIPNLRFAEAAALDVDVIATACPFCKIMLAPVPAEGGLEGRVVVKDIAELLAQACL